MNAAVAAAPAAADLVLARLLLPRATPANVRKDVGKLLDAEPSSADLAELYAELVAAGDLAKRPRNVFALTDTGRARALQFLGLSELPQKATWGTLVAKQLFPKASGLSDDEAVRLRDGDKLAAFVLKRKYGLPDNAGARVKEVAAALVCRELGYPDETTLDGLVGSVLGRLLGHDGREPTAKLVKQLPLVNTGLKSTKADDVRTKVVRDWLASAARREGAVEPTPPEPFDLTAFAATVRKLAGGSPQDHRFHDNKAFIAPLWRASQREPTFPRLTLAEFKERLVDANRAHLLRLSRADLVQAMDPTLVAESETTYLNASFHFVLIEENRP